ncbi:MULTISPECIES: oligosaccharide flippase family protein [Pseudomonas fluorescens group]|uniref:RfbX protein n=2 Tax=Pseudomonas fluorescens group TaxID=136843 RepID=A0A0D0SPC3_PSEFL|nr:MULTISPECIES: oligosaccharide flippase family protein [Pseudomonas fluorescens group]AZE62676.1 hypothetical protein C4K02_4331 [Pseudomonas synxantha]KIR23598.1 putative O-antigen transporter [Pseudomonas fluorescens]
MNGTKARTLLRRFSFDRLRQHSVTRNASALGLMQVVNFAVPLMLLPFLTRQLGMEGFGQVAVVLAAIQVAYVLTDYGFSFSATYAVSLNRDDRGYINKKIGAIFAVKALLLIPTCLALLSAAYLIPTFNAYFDYFVIAIIAVIAQAFLPIWLFQGLERMRNVALYTVGTKVLYVLAVLWVVDGEQDGEWVITVWALAHCLGLAIAIHLMRCDGYRLVQPEWRAIKHEFIEGAPFFWSRLAVSFYTSASLLIVGAYSASHAAQFAVSEQIYKAGQNIASPINNALFPYMARYKDWRVFFRIVTVMGVLMALGCLALALFAQPLLVELFGEAYRSAEQLLLVFLLISVVNYFAVTFGYSAFSALGRVSFANVSVMLGAAFYTVVLAAQYLFFSLDAYGIAVAILLTELVVMCLRVGAFFYFKRTLEVAPQ